MTSNELNKILNKTRRTPNISLTPEQVKELIKELEQKELLETELKLEKDKVKYVMKQLKKQDKMLNSMSNYTLTYKDDKGAGFVIEMWSDFEGFENVKDWFEKVYQNNKKIERMLDKNDK